MVIDNVKRDMNNVIKVFDRVKEKDENEKEDNDTV